MAKIHIKTKVGIVTFDSPSDAAEFVAALERGGKTRTRSRTIRHNQKATLKQTIKLLEVVDDARERGITSEQLAQALGMKGARALASVSTPARNDLAKVNMRLEEAIQIIRSPDGNRWKATNATDTALIQLRELVKKGEE